jgi:hypothetical protein
MAGIHYKRDPETGESSFMKGYVTQNSENLHLAAFKSLSGLTCLKASL